MNLIALLIFSAVFFSVCSLHADDAAELTEVSETSKPAMTSVSCMLAKIDYKDVSLQDVEKEAAKYDGLLDSLHEKCANTRGDIGNILARSVDILGKRGITMSMYDFGKRLEWYITASGESPKSNLADSATTYIILLTSK
ncbi:hypothetical protein ACFL3J_02525 [Candidatus Omnitrophota bacterium]